MDKTLYELMDWAAIEEITYSEAQNPHEILGAHLTEKGILVQCFIPRASEVWLLIDGNKKPVKMELADEEGFYACLTDRKKLFDYSFRIVYDNGSEVIKRDPYSFEAQYGKEEIGRFACSTAYDIYRKMGAHKIEIKGISGVYFSVWAPQAMRVSVVGDFNLWDGRTHQMRRLGDSGVYELFIPGLSEGELYKFEIKTAKGEPMLKSDPYGFYNQLRPDNASIVYDIEGYNWQDEEWLANRKNRQSDGKKRNGNPINVYEVHLGSWMRRDTQFDDCGMPVNGSEFYNYRDIAERLADYVKSMGYTHVELMPVMEHPLDQSWGYQVTGYYAPSSRYGEPKDFMYFIDFMHREGIGVILDWVPAHFPKDLHGLAAFDGTHVYEHADPRQGEHPHWGTLIYNYGRPQVSNFLIANALYWAEYYHADGIRMDAVASMLYLDYGKNDGEWVANIYGGHENLEAIEFLKHLNSIFKKKHPDVLLIAEESTAWPKVTMSPEDDGLGFDFKWNMGWMNDFLGYMSCDPYFRSHHYGELTFSMLYQYSENFMLVLSHDEVVHGKSSLGGKMPGATQEEKASNLRVLYGHMMTHPGKKLLFMGQEFAQMDEWNENANLQWGLLDYPVHRQLWDYVRDLNGFYKAHSALWELDCEPEGFEWINCHSYKENVIAFLRKSKDEELLIVSNFTPVSYEKFDVGVPYHGRYKEIFNSDRAEYGGSAAGNPRVKTSKPKETDERDESVCICLPPMSTVIFSVEKVEKAEESKKSAVEKADKKKIKTDKRTKK